MDKRKLGYLIASAGGLLFIYAIGFFDTTVAVDAYTRVHNLGLLNQQKNMMWAGGLLVIVGLVVALQLKAKFSSSLLASPDGADRHNRLNTTLVSQQSQSVGSSHPNQVSARSFDGERELTNDAYKIYLTKKYNFEKNEILGKIACEGSLFDSVEEALMHAHELEQQQQDSLQAKAENEQKRLELAKDLGIEEKAFGHGYKVLGQKFYDLDDAIAFAKKERAKRAG